MSVYGPTNEARRARAQAALDAYQLCDDVEAIKDGATFEQVLTDLLTDLRHAAHAHDVECFNNSDATAQGHFEIELNEARELSDDEIEDL